MSDARDEYWYERIFAVCPPKIDTTQLDENLKRTPAERLERLQEMVTFLEEVRGKAKSTRR